MDENVYKQIMLTGTSNTSMEEAVKSAVARAAKTVRHMRWFEVIETRGTIAEGATLHFQRIPLELQCTECNTQYHPDGKSFACPECGSNKVKVIKGDGLNLVALDVDKEGLPKEEVLQ